MPDQDASFSAAIERLRRERGLTPAQLARALGEYEGNVSRWRRGKGIDQLNVWKLADFFGVERAYLERLAGYDDNARSRAKERAELNAEELAIRATTEEMAGILRGLPRVYWGTIIKAFTRGIDGARDMAYLLAERDAGERTVRTPDDNEIRSQEEVPNKLPRNVDDELAGSYRPAASLLVAT
jgi:transcriptional regulator with XRE-family HTH domain